MKFMRGKRAEEAIAAAMGDGSYCCYYYVRLPPGGTEGAHKASYNNSMYVYIQMDKQVACVVKTLLDTTIGSLPGTLINSVFL
jgi:hypothetical protein